MRLFITIAMITVAGCKHGQVQPGIEAIAGNYIKANLPGWSFVEATDYSPTWWSFYDRTQAHNAITLDLNDDRLADHALLLKKDNNLRLVVLLGSGNGSYTHWIAEDFHPVYENPLKNIQHGLAVEPPAQIDVLEPEEKSLILQSNAITLLDMEERALIYHWEDGTIKTFYAK